MQRRDCQRSTQVYEIRESYVGHADSALFIKEAADVRSHFVLLAAARPTVASNNDAAYNYALEQGINSWRVFPMIVPPYSSLCDAQIKALGMRQVWALYIKKLV